MFRVSRRVLSFLALNLAVLALTIACSPKTGQLFSPTSPTADVEETFTVAISEDVGVLNPHTYDAHIFAALAMIYEPLVRYAEDGSIQPVLAESWQASADNLTWTFKLRQGVAFQDGTPFNAEAAKWNLQQWVNVADHDWLPVSTQIAAIETPDSNTLVLRMKEPYYATLQELTLVRPVRFLSPKAMDGQGKFTQPVGTGPWKVAEYTPDQKLVLTPSETYWGEQPTLSQVVLDVIPDPQTRVAALVSQEVDLIGGEYLGGIPVESIVTLQNNPDVEMLTADGTTTYIIQMNYRRSPFNDVRVRQALNHAIDREAIGRQVFNNLATPAQGFFAPNLPYVAYPDANLYTHNPDQARALLQEAGWTAGDNGALIKEGKPLQWTMIIDTELFPQAKSMAEVVQAELKQVGIEMQIRQVNSGGRADALESADFDMTFGITYGAPYDPHSSLKDLFSSTGEGSNHGGFYADAELDRMIDQVLKTQNEDDRKTQYTKIWQYLDEKAVAIPVLFSQRVYALNKRVQGFDLAGTEYELDLQGVTKAES